VIRHPEHPSESIRTLLLGVGAGPRQAASARADGADLIDVSTATPAALAAIRASLPAAVLWAGSPADLVDADRLAAATGPDDRDPPAAVIATAAVCTWLGAPVIRSRHTRAVRRAIDMAASIAGDRPPSRTTRGLA
jgi:dihydropteroate synthase